MPRKTVRQNPPKGTKTIASDVLAIVYRHQDDGREYVHVFGIGNEESPALVKTNRKEYIDIEKLPARTGVRMFFSPDRKTLTLVRGDGLVIVERF